MPGPARQSLALERPRRSIFLGVDLLARRRQQIPLLAEALDVLAVDIAGRRVLDEIIERPAVIGDLLGAVLAGDRADQCGVNLVAGLGRVGEQRWPGLGAIVVSSGLGLFAILAVGVGLEQIERLAVTVGDVVAQLVVRLDLERDVRGEHRRGKAKRGYRQQDFE